MAVNLRPKAETIAEMANAFDLAENDTGDGDADTEAEAEAGGA